MHRIDAPGFAPGNLFTEGNPSLSIPATEVSDNWLNDVQENIAQYIESEGIALIKDDFSQLTAAIAASIGTGGANTKLDPLLNNTVDQVVPGLSFDKTAVKAAIIGFDVHRQTDSSNVQESGYWIATHDSKDDVWRITTLMSAFDDSGTLPNITSVGQVRATTDNLAGSSYAAQLRITSVFRFAL